MARIPQQEIDRIKQEVSLIRLVESAGIALKKKGKDWFGCCPFHDDKTPSLSITPDKNVWHCLGACQSGGDVFRWVEKMHGVSFTKAYHMLKEQSPALAASRTPVKQSRTPKLATDFTVDADDQLLLNQVIDYYHDCLKQSPEALAYLEKRGLNHPELINHFKLGFANRTLGYRLPEKNRKAGAAIRGGLQRLGIMRSSGHEHFRGSLVVPIIMPRDGQHGDMPGGSISVSDSVITEVYGRKIRNDLRKGTAYHLYLPGPHKGVFNAEALRTSREIILCESLIDAMTFWCAGFRNVTASYGTSGFTAEHLAAFKQYKTQRVLIAYDRDEAGNNAATDLAAKLMKQGIDCYRILFPKNMDANEYACQVQPASKSLGVCIRSAIWLGDAHGCASVAEGRKPRATEGDKPELKTIVDETIADETVEIKTIEEKTPVSNKPEIETLGDGQQVNTQTGELLPEEKPAAPHAAITNAPVIAAEKDTIPEQASPVEPAKDDIPIEVKDQEIILTFGDRRYRVRGLDKNLSVSQLKINLLVTMCEACDAQGSASVAGGGMLGAIHVDTLDLYGARPRYQFIKQAAIELNIKEDIIKKDLGKVLLKLEALQEENIKKALQPKNPVKSLDDAEKQAALNLLKQPDLLDQILLDYRRCGVVGEQNNKLVGYLAAVSRKLDKPLGVMVQSSSAAGKSSLMESVLAFMPEEDKVQYSAMTGQSLYYMEEGDLRHKILAIAEEEGAEQASYALKLLQSEGQLSIASTGKDPQSGRLTTHVYEVQGPVMIFSTTTSIEPDEELLNRCIILGVDEGREQTRAIHEQQRRARTLEGLAQKKQKQKIIQQHQNAQRLLKPISVLNPYAEHLSFLSDRTRLRRDHEKYLTLIDTIVLLHQYQRPIKHTRIDDESISYIEATIADIKTANQLANELLGKSLDELPPQTRRLLTQINQMVTERSCALAIEKNDVHFSRKELREHTGISDTQLRLHLGRLVELEYLLVHRGGRGQHFVYELLYDGEGIDGSAFLMGLIDVAALIKNDNTAAENTPMTQSSRGKTGEVAGSTRPQRGGDAGGVRCNKNAENTINTGIIDEADKKPLKKAHVEKNKNNALSCHSAALL